ncbi:hypothetical protein C8Q79DRAFT_924094 [Trametes meyenii]|nr:hypothetical protein C8Q79DRAFT_924094 [Trametes meyenii]
MSTVLVDDSNPIVQYQSGWDWQPGVSVEVDGTRHQAKIAGITASLAFTGSGIQVVGTLGPSDSYGQPKTTYTIDNKLVGSYDAPFTPSGTTLYNVTFFSIGNLQHGDHEIVITNTDGTSPNAFFLDYFLVDPSAAPAVVASPPAAATTPQSTAPSPTTPSSPTLTTTHTVTQSPPSQATSQSQSQSQSQAQAQAQAQVHSQSSTQSQGSQTLTSSASGSGSASSPTSASTVSGSSSVSTQLLYSYSNGSASVVSTVTVPLAVSATATTVHGAKIEPPPSSSSHVGAIIGGAVGGAFILIVLVGLLICLRRRRQLREDNKAVPFNFAQDQFVMRGHSPSTTANTKQALAYPFDGSNMVSRAAAPVTLAHDSPFIRRAPAGGPTPYEDQLDSHDEPRRPLDPRRRSGYSAAPSSSTLTLLHADFASTSPSSVQPPPPSPSSASHTSPSATSHADVPLVPKAAVVPPGTWHAPPGMHMRAQALLGSLFSSRSSRVGSESGVEPVQDIDSGLRLYDNGSLLPPPYTQD